jgi:hypothetical protein
MTGEKKVQLDKPLILSAKIKLNTFSKDKEGEFFLLFSCAK